MTVLTNAMKYTDPGGAIRIHTRSDENSVFIEISDNGCGIAPELLPRIFDLFVQSERTLERSQGGLGIGLAVAKRLLQMHGGDISASSAGPGQGSTFEIRLPRIARPGSERSQMATPKSKPKRVLIVDDNTDAADSLAMLLAFQNHETRVVYDGTAALACIEAFAPEVALIDIGLPGLDGYEVARRIRSLPQFRGLRLVALTGYGQAEDQKRTRDAGFDDHVVKPADMVTLECAVAGVSAPGRGAAVI